MIKRGRSYVFEHAATDDGGAGGGGGPPAAPAAPAPAAPAAPAATASSLIAPGAGDPANDTAWLPEKFQVKKADGTLDEAATLKKAITEGYAPLEKKLGAGATGTVPATAAEYAPTLPDGVVFDELKTDPLYTDFLGKAHANRITNEQLSFVLEEYFTRAPELAGAGAAMTAEAGAAALKQVWTDDATFTKNIDAASGAIHVIAAKSGISVDDINAAGLGTNPVFMRLMHSIADEFQPDGTTPGGEIAAKDFDEQLAELKSHPAYGDAKHPEHKKLMDAKAALYARRYPEKKA